MCCWPAPPGARRSWQRSRPSPCLPRRWQPRRPVWRRPSGNRGLLALGQAVVGFLCLGKVGIGRGQCALCGLEFRGEGLRPGVGGAGIFRDGLRLVEPVREIRIFGREFLHRHAGGRVLVGGRSGRGRGSLVGVVHHRASVAQFLLGLGEFGRQFLRVTRPQEFLVIGELRRENGVFRRAAGKFLFKGRCVDLGRVGCLGGLGKLRARGTDSAHRFCEFRGDGRVLLLGVGRLSPGRRCIFLDLRELRLCRREIGRKRLRLCPGIAQ